MQTQRYFWKVNLVEERERELHEGAVALPHDASAKSSVYVSLVSLLYTLRCRLCHSLRMYALNPSDDIEYRQLSVTGTFKPDSTFYLCTSVTMSLHLLALLTT